MQCLEVQELFAAKMLWLNQKYFPFKADLVSLVAQQKINQKILLILIIFKLESQ